MVHSLLDDHRFIHYMELFGVFTLRYIGTNTALIVYAFLVTGPLVYHVVPLTNV